MRHVVHDESNSRALHYRMITDEWCILSLALRKYADQNSKSFVTTTKTARGNPLVSRRNLFTRILSVSQATRLADELRRIASTEVTVSSALEDIGGQLVAESLAERPLPRCYMLPSTGDIHNAVVEEAGDEGTTTDSMKSSINAVAQRKNGLTISLGNTGDITDGGSVEDKTTHAEEDVPRRSAANEMAITAAIEVAAGKEETAAAMRIQGFLKRRRKEKLSTVSPAEVAPVTTKMSAGSLVDDEHGSGYHGWLGAAVRCLHHAVDIFLLGGAGTASPDCVPSATTSSWHNELHPAGGEQRETNDADKANVCSSKGADNDHADNRGDAERVTVSEIDATKKRSDSNLEHSDDESCCWPIFPPLPLRARAPSLYTLPAFGSDSWGTKDRRGSGPGGGDPTSTAHVVNGGKHATDVSTKLNTDVAARLSSARSVFALRATDILVAFSPSLPPPPPRPSSTPLGADINIALAVPGRSHINSSRRRRLSSEGLRKRLCRELEDAGRAGLGRSLGSASPRHGTSSRGSVPARRQRHVAAPYGEEDINTCGHKGHEGDSRGRPQQPSNNTRYPSPGLVTEIPTVTALGRRLLAQRLQARRGARRRRMLGKADGFRARHVGRQLRIEASMDALEGMHRVLDRRVSIVREETKVSTHHMQQLLGFVDRVVFSDSQVRLSTDMPAANNIGNGG